MSEPVKQRRFDRGAQWHFILMAALLIFAVSSTIYRFTLPTDGWLSAEPEGFDSYGFIYQRDIMGSHSALQPGDHLVAVGGVSLVQNSLVALWPLSVGWQEGSTARYMVLRGGQEVQFDAPLVKWDPLRYARGNGVTGATLMGYLGITAFLVVGFLAFWRRPDVPAARALWVLSASVFSLFSVLDILPTMISDKVDPLASLSRDLFITAVFTVLLPPAFIRFALVFPKPVPALQRRPWLAYVPYAIGLVGVGAFVVGFYVFGWVWMAVSTFVALVILVHNAVTMRDAVSRAQLRWGLGGMLAGLGLFLLTFITVFFDVPGPIEDLLNSLTPLGFGVMGVALGIAVLRYRLFDIDVIIRKTLVYAALTGLLALVYFGSIALLQGVFTAVSGQSSAVAIVISTLAIAALFTPLRRRIQDVIDHRFFRKKYDAEQVLARFAKTARDETDLDSLTAELARVVQETMQPEHVSVWLKERSS